LPLPCHPQGLWRGPTVLIAPAQELMRRKMGRPAGGWRVVVDGSSSGSGRCVVGGCWVERSVGNWCWSLRLGATWAGGGGATPPCSSLFVNACPFSEAFSLRNIPLSRRFVGVGWSVGWLFGGVCLSAVWSVSVRMCLWECVGRSFGSKARRLITNRSTGLRVGLTFASVDAYILCLRSLDHNNE